MHFCVRTGELDTFELVVVLGSGLGRHGYSSVTDLIRICFEQPHSFTLSPRPTLNTAKITRLLANITHLIAKIIRLLATSNTRSLFVVS